MAVKKPSLVSALDAVEAKVDRLISSLTHTSKTMAGPGGRITSGSNFLNNALGSFSTTASVRAESAMGLVGGAARGAGNMFSGYMGMLPNTDAVVQRAGTYYNAALRVPGMGRTTLQKMTLGSLQGGLTSPGADADVANYLTMQGVMPSAKFDSYYQQTLRNVNASAKYLNMSNQASARAIEGLTSGPGSANMMRNFGIFTADPRTGQPYSENQIFQQISARATAGQPAATVEEVGESLRRGNLGEMLRNSGLSSDQQYRMSQMFLLQAAGKPTDLSDPNAMKGLEDANNKNPFAAAYNLNTATTNGMQGGEAGYLAGINAATAALEGLTNAANGLNQAMGGVPGGMKGFGDTFGGGAVGQGFGSFLGGGLEMAGNLGMLALLARGGGLGKAATSLFGAKAGSNIAKGTSFLGKGMKGVGLSAVASLAGNALGSAVAGNSEQGSAQSRFGGAISGAATGAGLGAMVGSVVPVIGTGIGALAGGVIGGLVGAGAGGETDGKGNKQDSGAPSRLSLIHPINPAKISAKWGQKYYNGKELWPNGHNGVDYVATEGQTIFAAAEGTVTAVKYNSGDLGTHVVVKHSSGHYTFYCHLSSVSVKEGATVRAGTPVGGAGKTGRATGTHLHFALATSNSTGSAIDPSPYMTGSASQDTYSGEQTPTNESPASQGDSAKGQQDISGGASSAGTNILQFKETGYGAAGASTGGASAASGVKPWSASNVSSTPSGRGATTTDQPTGGEGYVGDDQYGFSSDTSTPVSGKTRRLSSSGTVNNNVTINLTVSRATEEESRKFSRMLKKELEKMTLGRNAVIN